MSKQLFLKKSIRTLLSEASSNKAGLKKTLGPWSLLALGIGAIIGAGIFVLSGEAAAQYAGPAISISFILAAIIGVFAALCYAEFASLIPIAGSAYSYAYVTMGELIAWIIGWGSHPLSCLRTHTQKQQQTKLKGNRNDSLVHHPGLEVFLSSVRIWRVSMLPSGRVTTRWGWLKSLRS
jgi:hypothetical protein